MVCDAASRNDAMKSISFRNLALFALLASTGCASLKVQVDVMNPTYARAMTAGSEIVQGGHIRADRFVSASRTTLLEFRDRCFALLIDENQKLTQSPLVIAATQSLITARDSTAEKVKVDTNLLEPLRVRLYAADDAALARLAAAPEADTPKPIVAAAALQKTIAAWELAYSQATAAITGNLAANVGCPVTQARSSATQTQLANAEQSAQQGLNSLAFRSVVGNGVLLNNMREAFYVTTAPEQYWAKKYNRAFGSGQFGSSSIAVKLNDTADFSIKGFVFDGRSTAEMVKKLGIQTITTVAAAYGAPIGFAKSADSPGMGSVSFDAASLLATSQTAGLDADAKTAAYRLALFQIADAVMSNWDDLAKNDANAELIVDAVTDAQTAPYLKGK